MKYVLFDRLLRPAIVERPQYMPDDLRLPFCVMIASAAIYCIDEDRWIKCRGSVAPHLPPLEEIPVATSVVVGDLKAILAYEHPETGFYVGGHLRE